MVTPDEITLGLWIQAARKDYKAGWLDETSIQRLEAVGMIWDGEADQRDWYDLEYI